LTAAFLDEQRETLANLSQKVAATGGPLADPTKPSSDAVLRARESVVHVLLNHHDFVTIR
jgi:hypothetical protein